jgi:PAS domain-containing protein
MADDLILSLGMVLTATLVVLSSLVLLQAFPRRRPGPDASIFQPGDDRAAVFLFDGDRLLDATASARQMLPEVEDRGAWQRLLIRLGPTFPGLAETVADLPRSGQVHVVSAPGVMPALVLRGEVVGGLTRLSMIEAATEMSVGHGSAVGMAALQHEVLAQRAVLARSPVLIWREGPEDQVIWANHAYLIRAIELLPDGADLTWPLPRLFDIPSAARDMKLPRAKLQMQAGPEWFDLVRMPLGDEVLCYGVSANSAVQAETSLREFMQTLTKTFADLPIGLAIFDRSRILQLFNPALADLTTLAPDFLISRPTLSAVLDAMRAKAMIPEPKDYRSWRKQLMRLEEEAASGLFEETWNLPGGQTYRVIGRPHPNGALAFMFEDISTEMTRTRRYRADLELGQSVIDTVDEAVAVFSQGGQLVMSNLAYAQLWSHDPAVMLSDAGIGSLCSWWRDQTAPSLMWDDASDFVLTMGDRAGWDGEARMLDGRLLACKFRPLTGGATLITFRARQVDMAVGPMLGMVSRGMVSA